MPFARKHYRWYLPLFPLAIERLNVSGYDLVISSSYSVAKGIKTGKGQKHVCYCHSPVRYAHDMMEDYLDDMAGKKPLIRPLMRKMLKRIARWDIQSSYRVTCFIANSANVQERIKRLYQRKSVVLHPPVRLGEFNVNEDKEEFFLAASRQVPYKRTDIIVEAFRSMPERKLIVTGDGTELERLRELAAGADNIQILGQVERNELVDLMSRARAFINASHEDLGLSVVEALASGTPVIAYAKGGVLETTREGFSALYFLEQKANSLRDAVLKFEKSNFASPTDLRASAASFDGEHFRQKFKELVDQCPVS